MSTQDKITFVLPTELSQVIKDTSLVPGKDYLVVDVRDDDYEVNLIILSNYYYYIYSE
jgi:hypothetical protein